MPSIYGGATVTIVAARSSSSADGFLGERFAISYRCIEGGLGSVTLAQLGDGFEPVEAIDERGWTLQERLLLTRIVEFGSRQTRWICPATTRASWTSSLPPGQRSPTYRGPSWSWLSVDGPVQFTPALRPAECAAEILRVDAEPAVATAPFGMVHPDSGRLVLCAAAGPAAGAGRVPR